MQRSETKGRDINVTSFFSWSSFCFRNKHECSMRIIINKWLVITMLNGLALRKKNICGYIYAWELYSTGKHGKYTYWRGFNLLVMKDNMRLFRVSLSPTFFLPGIWCTYESTIMVLMIVWLTRQVWVRTNQRLSWNKKEEQKIDERVIFNDILKWVLQSSSQYSQF